MRVKKTRTVYAVCILAAALLVAAFFVFGKGDKSLTESEQQDNGVVMDNETVRVLVSDALTGKVPVKNLRVSIYGDGRIAFSGAVNAEDIRRAAREGGNTLPSGVRMLLSFLPEENEVCCELRAAADAQNRSFDINLQKLEVNGMELSGDLIPASVGKALTDRLCEYLESRGVKIGAVEFRDGAIVIKN